MPNRHGIHLTNVFFFNELTKVRASIPAGVEGEKEVVSKENNSLVCGASELNPAAIERS
jgi:hypothetical protein